MKNFSMYDSNIENGLTVMQKIVASKMKEQESRSRALSGNKAYSNAPSVLGTIIHDDDDGIVP